MKTTIIVICIVVFYVVPVVYNLRWLRKFYTSGATPDLKDVKNVFVPLRNLIVTIAFIDTDPITMKRGRILRMLFISNSNKK